MIRSILKSVYQNLLPLRIKNSIDLFGQLRHDNFDRPELVQKENLRHNNILVLAPHPDDDVIGCGGILGIYQKMGAKITIAYMTDGRKGNPKYDENTLVLQRREEAKKATAVLGIDKLTFFDNRDTELSATPKTVKELQDILHEVKPEAVFLPFLLDNHHDHRATNDILIKSSLTYKAPLTCYGYEIWTPIATPNFLVNITDEIEVKRQAIEQHHSQTELCYIADCILGLCRYRSLLYNLKDVYVEAFFRCKLDEYKRLWQAVH
jgi:LmbE family N-acetylglucosaminyl deacetylase